MYVCIIMLFVCVCHLYVCLYYLNIFSLLSMFVLYECFKFIRYRKPPSSYLVSLRCGNKWTYVSCGMYVKLWVHTSCARVLWMLFSRITRFVSCILLFRFVTSSWSVGCITMNYDKKVDARVMRVCMYECICIRAWLLVSVHMHLCVYWCVCICMWIWLFCKYVYGWVCVYVSIQVTEFPPPVDLMMIKLTWLLED